MSSLHAALRASRRLSAARGSALSRFGFFRSASSLVIGENENGTLSGGTLSAVTAASKLTSSVCVLLGGHGDALQEAAKKAAKAHSAISEVWIADWEKLEHGLAEPWAELVQAAEKKGKFSYVVAASSSFGKNVLPRAAVLLDRAVISDVVSIMNEKTFVRPIYAGNALSTVRYNGSSPCFLTFRTTAFPSEASPRSESAPISTLDHKNITSGVISRSEWVGIETQESERPDLGSARVVVSGGRALKTTENFKLLYDLADKLGGAVGASRAAVDGGMVPNELQVGQTGKIVAPDLYIAVGISGAIQHLAGMKDSKVIVAINKDPDCPIFQVADYGLTGDLFQILPELTKKIPAKGAVNA